MPDTWSIINDKDPVPHHRQAGLVQPPGAARLDHALGRHRGAPGLAASLCGPMFQLSSVLLQCSDNSMVLVGLSCHAWRRGRGRHTMMYVPGQACVRLIPAWSLRSVGMRIYVGFRGWGFISQVRPSLLGEQGGAGVVAGRQGFAALPGSPTA